jgi:hypothetical protein
MRFRRRVKLFPGVTLNFSKTGISTTVGVPGASVNFNKQGTFLNTGLPGTGIYDRKRIGGKKQPSSSNQNFQDFEIPQQEIIPDQRTELKSTENVEETTTEGLQELRDTLLSCYQEKNELKREIAKAKSNLQTSQILLVLSYLIIVGFFIKWFKQNRDEKKEYLADLEKQLSECYVNIDIKTDEQIEKTFIELLDSYKTLLTCQKIWDITSTSKIDKAATRSAASESITRKQVKFGFGNLDIIKSKFDALHFENANGGDLYIYPAFMAIVDSNKKFGLIDIREVEFDFLSQKFLEEERVPSDSNVIGHTWAKVNKNGSPDKRFKDNYQIPICLYGNIEIKSSTGLNEAYCLSNHDKAEQFAMTFGAYQKTIGQ